ncbi:hypothetical protein CSUB01_04301 [Colletotrichum sublineola]|uniref:Uncharacterized protein n=1 Tax=Colletotrichum sublineola TaxID=1173701 RepID=A0A066X697_COLSU|nr:hypothetical protein CSUB01_04301 [Colletotrichum sublineola]
MPAQPVDQSPREPAVPSSARRPALPDQHLLIERPDADTGPVLPLDAVVQPRAASVAEPALRHRRHAVLPQRRGPGCGGGPLQRPRDDVERDEEGARLLAALRALARQRAGREVVRGREGDGVPEGAAEAAPGYGLGLGVKEL